MAVGMLLAGELVTRDTYVKVTEKIFGAFPMRSDQAPEGLILHTAGETSDGFYIYDVWESKEHFQRFNEAQVGPAMQEILGDVPADAPRPEPQFYDAEVVVGPTS
jgi:hypothetical protein